MKQQAKELQKQLEIAVSELENSSGHSIMSEEWGQTIADAFGVRNPIETFTPQKGDPKGVLPNWNDELNNGKGGLDYTPMVGVYALTLSHRGVRKLKLEIHGFHGRGSQYRADIKKIREYVEGLSNDRK